MNHQQIANFDDQMMIAEEIFKVTGVKVYFDDVSMVDQESSEDIAPEALLGNTTVGELIEAANDPETWPAYFGSTIDQVVELVLENHDKYLDLVSFARKRPEDYCHQGVKVLAETVKFKYPQELAELENPETSDWAHGFNSGMLAGMRLVMTAMSLNTDIAKDFFPELDT